MDVSFVFFPLFFFRQSSSSHLHIFFPLDRKPLSPCTLRLLAKFSRPEFARLSRRTDEESVDEFAREPSAKFNGNSIDYLPRNFSRNNNTYYYFNRYVCSLLQNRHGDAQFLTFSFVTSHELFSRPKQPVHSNQPITSNPESRR